MLYERVQPIVYDTKNRLSIPSLEHEITAIQSKGQ